MEKARIGILTFSDGRELTHQELLPMNQALLDRVTGSLRETGEIELVVGEEIIWTPHLAAEQGSKMVRENVDGTIFNFSIWSFPHLAVIAAQHAKAPFLMLSNINPAMPGLVGMMASAGALDQLGIKNTRLFGDVSGDGVLRAKVLAWVRAARAVSRLKGQTFGLIGGRSMGMYTATVDPRQWQMTFGVDVEHIDQLEIVRLARDVPDEVAERALTWLEENMAAIEYDDKQLTREKLLYQIKCHEATKRLIRDWKLDFLGVKCHPELSSNYVCQCLSAAFCNDGYDWDGMHEPIVYACETDMDGAMTMQILRLLTGEPALFADFRHYDASDDTFVFSNCGSQATYFAGAASTPAENLKKTYLVPAPAWAMRAGGANVHYVAKAGEVTLARLARKDGRYWMAIMPGEFVEGSREQCRELTPEWPACFAKLKVTPEELISSYGSNHAHGVYGNRVNELVQVCSLLGIESRVYV